MSYNALQNQLISLQVKRENEAIVYETWKEEENLIMANKKVSGDNAGLNAAQLTAIADLYRSRLLEVKQKLLESKRRSDEINKEINKVQSQINEWTAKNANQNTGEVVIGIIANNTMESVVEISYFDSRAYWQTGFDLKLENLQKPLVLVNKGRITQSTGEDWKGVAVVLTTGNPGYKHPGPSITTLVFILFCTGLCPLWPKNKCRTSQSQCQEARM